MAKVAIIVPTYNSNATIEDCLNSIIQQTYSDDISLYIIDDNSNDNTLEIINKFGFTNNVKCSYYNNVNNMKQGYCRNKMLNNVVEDYVVFLDSDDMLHCEFITKSISYLESNLCDIVYTQWVYINDINFNFNYSLTDSILENNFLVGNECAKILSFKTYFSTPALYRTKFLKDNCISFGEGYWYEDYEFYVSCAMKANKIGLLAYPLYIIRVHKYSTTRLNYHTNIHHYDFLKALQNSLICLKPREESTIYNFYSCILKKAQIYCNRGLKKNRKKFMKSILVLLNNNNEYKVQKSNNKILNFFFLKNGIKNKRVNRYFLLRNYYNKKNKIKKILRKKNNKRHTKRKMNNNLIVFVGFDFKYKGNSKYLFEYLKVNNYNVLFIKEEDIYTNEYYKNLNEAKMIIFESWNHLKYRKKDGQVFLQLWHGSPYKKLFFDSCESYMVKKNNKYRKEKFVDYQKWDYLLCENESDRKIFNHAFPYNKYESLVFGYPRIKWLIDNNNNETKRKIKEEYRINKPFILYVPTWRDSQINNEEKSFLLDVKRLKKTFSNYIIIQSTHPYLDNSEYEMIIDKLLLVADIVISDYSSIVYDAIRINKKVLLYQNDRYDYLGYRGLYEKRDNFFISNDIVCCSEDSLIEKINNIDKVKTLVISNSVNYDRIYQNFEQFLKGIGFTNDKEN